jgi:hypothetical protein
MEERAVGKTIEAKYEDSGETDEKRDQEKG